jgi:hypothetical protein
MVPRHTAGASRGTLVRRPRAVQPSFDYHRRRPRELASTARHHRARSPEIYDENTTIALVVIAVLRTGGDRQLERKFEPWLLAPALLLLFAPPDLVDDERR